MKKVLILLISFHCAYLTIADFVTLGFTVKDESGTSIENAIVDVSTERDAKDMSWFGTAEIKEYSKKTKDDGMAKMKILCHSGAYDVKVSADGYYPCKMFGENCYRDVVDPLTGRHRSEMHDREYKIILRKMKKPVKMNCYTWTERCWRTPLEIGSYPFDLEIGDWVHPRGKGKTTDLIAKCEAVTNGAVLYIRGSIQFVKGGAYKRKKLKNMIFCSDYEADVKGEFLSEFPYECKENSTDLKESVRKYPLEDDEYWVFRVREKRDELGRLISAHYGKIYAPVRMFGQFYLEKIFFNPTPNDPNIEEKR